MTMRTSVLPFALFLCAVATQKGVAVTREVVFGPGRRLAGQLDKPPGDGPFPLVFLITAGGTLDRNGTSKRFEAFKDIYTPLVRIATDAGWAIFRYDRQGSGMSRRAQRNEIVDALDAVIVARDLPGVDPTRVVIVAHASGTEILHGGYPYFEETIGFDALKGVVLLSNTVGSQVVGRMAGDLLIILGESDEAASAAGAVSVHRRNYPDRRARAVVIADADHALCDTTRAGWKGWSGMPGSCTLPHQVYDAIGLFLHDVGRQSVARR